MKYWVGKLKDQFDGFKVFRAIEPEAEDYPEYEYVIGPFDEQSAANARAKKEHASAGMFHPFPGHPR